MEAVRRPRWLSLIDSSKGRKKLLATLAHGAAWKPECVVPVPGVQHTVEALTTLLRARAAPDTCWVVSEDAALDGRFAQLTDALSRTIGSGMGTVLSCIPGELALHESESIGGRCLLVSPRRRNR